TTVPRRDAGGDRAARLTSDSNTHGFPWCSAPRAAGHQSTLDEGRANEVSHDRVAMLREVDTIRKVLPVAWHELRQIQHRKPHLSRHTTRDAVVLRQSVVCGRTRPSLIIRTRATVLCSRRDGSSRGQRAAKNPELSPR